MSKLAKEKVAIIVQTAAPYRDNTIKKFIEENPQVQVDCFLINTQAKSMHPEWNYTTPLKFKNKREKEPLNTPFGTLDFEILKYVLRGKYSSILISGWFPATSLLIAFFCILFRKRFSVMLDSVEINGKSKRLALFILKYATTVFVPGNMSKNFLIREGIVKSKIFKGVYTNDTEEMYQIIKSEKEKEQELREKYNIPQEDYLFLFVGKLIPSRKIRNLLNAIAKQEKHSSFLIVGDGPDRHFVTEAKEENSNIVYLPSVPLKDLHSLYAIANAYIHPGKEPFSLALVEAAVAGIPIVTTDEVGAAFDVVRQNENGLIVQFDDVEELTSAICQVRNGEIAREKVSAMSHYLVTERNILWSASQLAKVLGIK
ncbi:Glycosyl transferases group 1 [Pilibacter termitis]|uniref:Glycosyl transferases group 1 n=1 Tax=Pilibacter termitis TaxID=263852 RepID=A0A1T4P3P7_9ENTE|nr:glycosyltransferase [Pilibacter termitis]SJZ86143.1 Glycosyl transferases group 1 [Pilibacter termitis]